LVHLNGGPEDMKGPIDDRDEIWPYWPFETTVSVEIVEPMGSDTSVWARLGGQNVTMRVTAERAPRVGDAIAIGFDPVNASLFDTAGDRL
jgi:multiple sugar transport system ATP-binding protein